MYIRSLCGNDYDYFCVHSRVHVRASDLFSEDSQSIPGFIISMCSV